MQNTQLLCDMDKKTMLIQLIQHYEDGNKTRFAKRLGLTPQGVSTWLSRGTIDYELVYAKCEHLNAEWLLTGRGSMLRKDVPTPSEPVSAPSDAIAMRLMDKLDQKDAENKHLQSELRTLTAELAAIKALHSQSQNKESDHHTKISEVIENFTSDSSGDYGEGYPLTKKPTSSKRSSAGKM